MKFCEKHWEALKHAIHARGLGDFVSSSTEEALERTKNELAGKRVDKSNFDPLLAAHWAIVNNAIRFIGDLGMNPMALVFVEEGQGHKCPICYLNQLSKEHDETCTNPDCQKEKGMTFDNWIDKAADEVKAVLPELPEKAGVDK